MVTISTYYDASPDYHQQQFDASDGLFKKGYRIISLSVYREGKDVRYAAVWSNQGGPPWTAFHGYTPDGYQAYFDTWTKKGYRPIIVTATGGGILEGQTSDPIFAAVFVHDATPFTAQHGIDYGTFRNTCEWAKKNSHVLRWATIYGGIDRLYAGIWEKVNTSVKWDHVLHKTVEDPEEGVPVQLINNPSLRLSFVSRSFVGEYLGVYRSDQNQDIRERHGMTPSQFQTQHDLQKSQGYLPVCVQTGGDPRDSPPRFVAIFQKF